MKKGMTIDELINMLEYMKLNKLANGNTKVLIKTKSGEIELVSDVMLFKDDLDRSVAITSGE